ncbi:MAG: ATP-binding protein [Bacteroidales bacterium]|nr:ATP-binding protein [Bacteroidales bacterium]
MIDNPFSYGKTVDGPFFYGRETELEEIKLSMRNATNLIIYSPRRIGKSSLVLKALKDLEHEGHPVVYIDFFKVSSREKLIELYAREVVRPMKGWEKGLQWIQGLIRGIQPVMGLDQTGLPELRLSVDPSQTARAFEDIINLPVRSAREKCWIVVFDEFQEIEKLNGASFEKELRATIQHHRNVSYVFLGSQRHLLLNMFSRKERAFYNFGKLYRLQKPAEEASVQFLHARFKAGGFRVSDELVRNILDHTRNIPYYLQYLSAEIWEYARLSASEPEAIFRQALERLLINQNDYFQGIRAQFTPFQMKLLSAVALHGYGTYESEFLQKYRLYPTSSVQKAYKRLTDLDILEKQNNQFGITDPFFALWLKQES